MKQYTALGHNVFAGSILLGAQLAGLKLLGTVEHSEYGKATRNLNFPKLNSWQWDDLVALDFAQMEPLVGRVDLMVGNPPCAPFSSARHNKAMQVKKTALWRTDERVAWCTDAARLGRRLQVKAWVSESIVNAWKHGREYVDWIARQWVEQGYSMTVVLHNGMYCWSPQDRRRLFIVAHRHPLWHPELWLDPLTTAELLQGVHVPEAEKRWLKPERRVLWEHATRFHGSLVRAQRDLQAQGHPLVLGTQSFLDYRLMPDAPPRVFLSDSTRMHPTEPRYFHWLEMLALCGLPETWRSAETTMNARALELSRAVLPGVGRWIATAVKRGLQRPVLKKPEHRIIDLRDPLNQTVSTWDIIMEGVL